MNNEWLEYKETRREFKQKRPRALLSALGSLRLNASALELFGNPAAVSLLFDVQKSRIGLRAAELNVETALPLRMEKKNAQVHIKSFCNRYRIHLESTIEFADVRIDSDGVLLLDLTTARSLVVRRVGSDSANL